MKYIISSGTSVVSEITRESGVTLGFSVSVDSDMALKFDTYGDAMKLCVTINNLIGKPAYKVDFIAE